jgi:hypothetical protein
MAMFVRALCLIGICFLIVSVSTAGVANPERDVENQPPTEPLPEEVSSDWWQSVQTNIRRSEYHITWQEKTLLPDVTAAFQAPNRAHNLRTYFTPKGIRVIPRAGDATAWQWGLTLTGYGYAGQLIVPEPPELVDDVNRMEYRRGDLVEWYVNDSRGIEQGFTLKQAPSAEHTETKGALRIEMDVSGDLCAGFDPSIETIEFYTAEGAVVLNYGDLHVYDAIGRSLPAQFDLDGSRISIRVDDEDAVYPITIDPLTATSDWSLVGESSGDELGISVATAGDVNGDGYSDVIVGVHRYDTSETDAGAAFVFEGTATGVNSTHIWTDEGDQLGESYGWSVATAGDVNGDGYSDIIVGAPYYDEGQSNEGAAYVYHGSSSGLSSTPSWYAQSDNAHDWMGWQVGTAGDIDGNGCSDVIIAVGGADWAKVWQGSTSSGLGDDGTGANIDWIGKVSGNQTGASAGTAGDVNGDGYSDVILGVPTYNDGETDEGGAFIWFGSSTGLGADGTVSNADWSYEPDVVDARFGRSVGTAGDVNGDGFADVIVGANRYTDGQNEEGAVFVFHGSSTGPSGTHDWTKQGNAADHRLGQSVGTAGDVNGDGFADIIVGAAKHDENNPSLNTEGWAYVYYGAATGLYHTEIWSNSGGLAQPEAAYGFSVGTAGDVNGDGYSDIIVGAPGYTTLPFPPKNNVGRVTVHLGSPSGLASEAKWSEEGPTNSLSYGQSVSTAGDVNGDGFDDVIVGDENFDGGAGTNEGGAWVYHGSGGGLNTAADWSATGGISYAGFGENVATAGDVNGDGYEDVIIGSSDWLVGSNNLGRVLVYHGSSSGLSSTADWMAGGNQHNGHFGVSVGTAGDVNGDGHSDVIVGASQYSDVYTAEGAVFLWFGSSSGLGPPQGIPGNADWWAVSQQGGAGLGISVATAGDVNGDGFSDIIAGATGYANGTAGEGGAFVWHGSASGPSHVGGKSFVSGANWHAESNQANAFLGNSVATAGDVDGDGYADVIVGAHEYDDTYSNGGAVFVWHGSSSGMGPNGTPANADWEQYGLGLDSFRGSSVACAGDVNGDGYADVVVGEPYLDGLIATEAGAAWAYYGSDTGLGDWEWVARGGKSYAHFGTSVSSAGDVNINGYADVVVGAPDYSGTSSTGLVQVFHGGEPNRGLNVNPRQLRTDSSPMARLNMSDHPEEFRLRTLARTPFGRGLIKMEWEVKALGSLFDGTGTKKSANWTDTDTSGVIVGELMTSLTPGTVYHWRVRFLYHPSTIPFQPASRWFTRPANGWQEADFRTPVGVASSVKDVKPPSTVECVAYPNPFNPSTTIRFYLPKSDKVTLEIFDVAGHRVVTLVNEIPLESGYHDEVWRGINDRGQPVSSGTYFFRLESAQSTVTGKLMLLK